MAKMSKAARDALHARRAQRGNAMKAAKQFRGTDTLHSRHSLNHAPRYGATTHPHHPDYLPLQAARNFAVKLRIANGREMCS